MGRKPRIAGSPEEKRQVVLEGTRAGTPRRCVTVPESLPIFSIAGMKKRNHPNESIVSAPPGSVKCSEYNGIDD
jgi:hypothetical protein